MSKRFIRSQRLLTAKDYSHVFEQVHAKAVSGPLLALARLHTPKNAGSRLADEEPQSRIGLIIAKKHLKHAVDRNRVKRCCRAVFRHEHLSFPHADIIVLLRGKPKPDELSTLSPKVEELFSRLSVKLHREASRIAAEC